MMLVVLAIVAVVTTITYADDSASSLEGSRRRGMQRIWQRY